MEVAVVADIVLVQGRDHIGSAPLLEYAGLLADELERGADAPLGEHFGKPLGGIVRGRQEIVFGIEPEDQVDGAGAAARDHDAAKTVVAVISSDSMNRKDRFITRHSEWNCRSLRYSNKVIILAESTMAHARPVCQHPNPLRTMFVHFPKHVFLLAALTVVPALAADTPPPFPADPQQALERTCFQTGQAWSGAGNLRSDVSIVYGIDPGLPKRIGTWRDRGYRIHVMTGVSWGNYQDYLYGRFDGVNHEDSAQTDRQGVKIGHGGDVYYMCPATNYGKFLCVGVQRALDAGAEAIHLEEPEFWVRGGYSEGFKREWRSYYGVDWQPPHASVDAQWRASKLKYFLYRRALQQVFDYVQEFNRRSDRHVRCYVPTHSLLNYAHWRIVSPESSLSGLNGCDGYIAQVWTGTSRTPNLYRGQLRERTFETAFLEYGAMQNLVRGTGRRVWYLNDPVEDNPDHDWEDYRVNWESTLVASLFQPDVWRYEVAPWPERIFAGRYRRQAGSHLLQGIPPAYATELQVVINALNDLKQSRVEWDCGTSGMGVIVGDSLMFERGDPMPSDTHLSHIYGLALPLLKRGMPVTPVQLENLGLAGYLDPFRVLFLTYQGMKPLSADVHAPLVDWVKRGGALVVVDDDSDPYNGVRDWWNSARAQIPYTAKPSLRATRPGRQGICGQGFWDRRQAAAAGQGERHLAAGESCPTGGHPRRRPARGPSCASGGQGGVWRLAPDRSSTPAARAISGCSRPRRVGRQRREGAQGPLRQSLRSRASRSHQCDLVAGREILPFGPRRPPRRSI